MDNDLSVKFGTDLLSHPLVSGQYHRLWRAYPLVSGSEWEEVDTADIGCCHGHKTRKGRYLMDNDLSVRLVSGQYHRLWRAYPLVSGSEWEEVDTADIGCCHGHKTRKGRYLMDNDLSVKFGTDLLSHMLLQYHRLWRA